MNIYDLLKIIKKETLTAEEKAAGLSLIKNFMVENPVQNPTPVENSPKVSPYIIKSPYFDTSFFRRKLFTGPLLAVFLLLVTGGVSSAANLSLPGDILYPVKIHFNEKVESFAAVGTKARTEVQLKHTIKRLNEAEQLSSQNKLSEKDKTTIEASISTNLTEVSQTVTKLKDSGKKNDASEIRAGVRKVLERHAKIISEISDKKSNEAKATATIKAESVIKNEDRGEKYKNKTNRILDTENWSDDKKEATTTEKQTRDEENQTETKIETETETKILESLPPISPL